MGNSEFMDMDKNYPPSTNMTQHALEFLLCKSEKCEMWNVWKCETCESVKTEKRGRAARLKCEKIKRRTKSASQTQIEWDFF